LAGNGQHILLVDDHAEILSLGRRVLTDAGYRVTTARGITATAKQLDSGEDFDLLCVDGSMTERTSECNLLARFAEAYPGRPIATCSGRIEKAQWPASTKETPTAFLAKPYSPTKLLATIGQLLAADKAKD
jgi:DNA-binding NtrC family response regulator